MHDPLNAIRRLYGEPGDAASEELSPEEQAEFEAMADLKAALDRLPPRFPDLSVVDAVVAAAGEAARTDALGLVRAVYGEGDEDADSAEAHALAEMKAGLDALPPQRPEPSLIDAVVAAAGEASRAAALAPIRAAYDEDAESLTTDAAEAEAAVLASMKDALDQLPPRRPDPSVIDAVMAAAAESSAPTTPVVATTGRAADRPARRPETRRRVAGALAAVFAVVVVFAGGLWMNQGAPGSQQIAEADRAEAQAPSVEEQIAEAAPPAASNEAEATASSAADLAASRADEPVADEGLVAAAAPPPPPSRQAEPAAARSAPSATPEVAESFDALDTNAATLARQSFADAAPAAGASADDVRLANAEALAQDADEELRLLYLRLREMQAAQAGLGWDTPPVALGAPPDSASSPAETGWMQVRVQR